MTSASYGRANRVFVLVSVSVGLLNWLAPIGWSQDAIASQELEKGLNNQPPIIKTLSGNSSLLQFQPLNPRQSSSLDGGDSNQNAVISGSTTNEDADAISAIRDRMGGGIADHLTDIVSPSEAESLFRQEIERLSRHRNVAVRVDPTSATLGIGWAPRPADSQTAAVRLIARQLDELAANLEELQNYEFADRLRIEAQKLRESVR